MVKTLCRYGALLLVCQGTVRGALSLEVLELQCLDQGSTSEDDYLLVNPDGRGSRKRGRRA